jgi:hypothetical protein
MDLSDLPVDLALTREKPRWQPRRLSPRHKEIIALKHSGLSRDIIAGHCKCTPMLVTLITECELGQSELSRLSKEIDDKMRGLYSNAVDALEDALDSSSLTQHRLKAAELVLEANGKKSHAVNPSDTAEDVVRRIMSNAAIIAQNVQINMGKQGA